MARKKSPRTPKSSHLTSTWTPSGTLTIAHAAALNRDAASTLDGVAPIHIDLSAVESVDTAGCQVLLASWRRAGRQGRAWRLSGASPRVSATFRLLGFEQMFGAGLEARASGGEAKESES